MFKKYFYIIRLKFLKNFLQISNISSKFWANNSKFVLQNLPEVRIFPKIFKMFLKLLFYNFSRLFQNFLKIISRFPDNFSQVFPKIDTKISFRMSKNLYKVFPTFFKIFHMYRYFKNIEKWIDILKISTRIDILTPLVEFSRNNDKKRAYVNKKVLRLYVHFKQWNKTAK